MKTTKILNMTLTLQAYKSSFAQADLYDGKIDEAKCPTLQR